MTLTCYFKAFWLVNILLKALSKTDQSKFPDTYKTQVIVILKVLNGAKLNKF